MYISQSNGLWGQVGRNSLVYLFIHQRRHHRKNAGHWPPPPPPRTIGTTTATAVVLVVYSDEWQIKTRIGLDRCTSTIYLPELPVWHYGNWTTAKQTAKRAQQICSVSVAVCLFIDSSRWLVSWGRASVQLEYMFAFLHHITSPPTTRAYGHNG